MAPRESKFFEGRARKVSKTLNSALREVERVIEMHVFKVERGREPCTVDTQPAWIDPQGSIDEYGT